MGEQVVVRDLVDRALRDGHRQGALFGFDLRQPSPEGATFLALILAPLVPDVLHDHAEQRPELT
ncbi:MAG: hypothetical protein L6Q99_01110 [Planctomycetes bacterium]|nr:hypothetical protein [Planctomycetota bacterium]